MDFKLFDLFQDNGGCVTFNAVLNLSLIRSQTNSYATDVVSNHPNVRTSRKWIKDKNIPHALRSAVVEKHLNGFPYNKPL
jgi:hypothetical protein